MKHDNYSSRFDVPARKHPLTRGGAHQLDMSFVVAFFIAAPGLMNDSAASTASSDYTKFQKPDQVESAKAALTVDFVSKQNLGTSGQRVQKIVDCAAFDQGFSYM